jgi:DNA-binding transcriptional LysR family regulator
MELHELEAFEAVAMQRSFTRAAEALYLTQPAVTRKIAALEAELRTRLFERLGRTVQLTSSGETLHRYAGEILRLAREAERAVSDVASGQAGRLAVGASSTTATYILPPLLRRFREAYPGVELSVHTGISAQVAEMVIANVVDVGVVTGFREQAGLVGIPLAEYKTGVVVYPGHPLASRAATGEAQETAVTAAELAGSPLILMEEGTNLRTYVDRLLSAAGVEERVTMELDNVEAIKKMIEARLGISLLPLVSVETEVAAGRLVMLPLADVPNAHRRIAAIHRQDKYLSTALKAFLALLKGHLS